MVQMNSNVCNQYRTLKVNQREDAYRNQLIQYINTRLKAHQLGKYANRFDFCFTKPDRTEYSLRIIQDQLDKKEMSRIVAVFKQALTEFNQKNLKSLQVLQE